MHSYMGYMPLSPFRFPTLRISYLCAHTTIEGSVPTLGCNPYALIEVCMFSNHPLICIYTGREWQSRRTRHHFLVDIIGIHVAGAVRLWEKCNMVCIHVDLIASHILSILYLRRTTCCVLM